MGTGRRNNFISIQSMPIYEKKDRNGNWQRKQLYFHTIDAIIWKKRQKRELAEETSSFQCNQFHNKLNVLLYDIPRPVHHI